MVRGVSGPGPHLQRGGAPLSECSSTHSQPRTASAELQWLGQAMAAEEAWQQLLDKLWQMTGFGKMNPKVPPRHRALGSAQSNLCILGSIKRDEACLYLPADPQCALQKHTATERIKHFQSLAQQIGIERAHQMEVSEA